MVKEKIKKSKGITLIALIITITILIILTALTVKIIVDGDMIDNTKTAVNDTNNKVEELQNKADKWEEELNEIIEDDDEETDKEEPEKIPQITLAYSPTLDTWTNEDVTVTANVDLSGYEIQMSDDGTTWEPSNTIKYESNGKVYARAVKNGSQVVTTAEGEVTNIDKTPPTVGEIIAYLNDGTTFQFVNKNLETTISNWSDIMVEKIDGSDSESGHKSTTYAVYMDSELTENAVEFYGWLDINAYELTGCTQLGYDMVYPPEEDIIYSEEDNLIASRASYYSVYWIEVKTLDNAGNEARAVYYIYATYL